MKKKIIITLIVIFLIICVVLVAAKVIKKMQKEREIIEIFEENIFFRVFVDNSYSDVDKIEKKILRINGIKDIEFHSKEQALEEMKERLDSEAYLLEQYEGENNILPNSFNIKIELNNLDEIENIKNIEEELSKIDGVNNVTSNYESYINIYYEFGIDGLRKYVELMNIVSEGDSEKVDEYLEQNEGAENLLKY